MAAESKKNTPNVPTPQIKQQEQQQEMRDKSSKDDEVMNAENADSNPSHKSNKKNINGGIKQAEEVEEEELHITQTDLYKQVPIRNAWKPGSQVSIYSESRAKWTQGTIARIYHDDEGEWMVVKYAGSTKEIQRFNQCVQPLQYKRHQYLNKKPIQQSPHRTSSPTTTLKPSTQQTFPDLNEFEQRKVRASQPNDLSVADLHKKVIKSDKIIIVSDLPPTATAPLLKQQWFDKYPGLIKVKFAKNKKNKSKHPHSKCAYVFYNNAKSALEALNFCKQVVLGDGNKLSVKFGYTGYCRFFLRGEQCTWSLCHMLHTLVEDERDITAAHDVDDIKAGDDGGNNVSRTQPPPPRRRPPPPPQQQTQQPAKQQEDPEPIDIEGIVDSLIDEDKLMGNDSTHGQPQPNVGITENMNALNTSTGRNTMSPMTPINPLMNMVNTPVGNVMINNNTMANQYQQQQFMQYQQYMPQQYMPQEYMQQQQQQLNDCVNSKQFEKLANEIVKERKLNKQLDASNTELSRKYAKLRLKHREIEQRMEQQELAESLNEEKYQKLMNEKTKLEKIMDGLSKTNADLKKKLDASRLRCEALENENKKLKSVQIQNKRLKEEDDKLIKQQKETKTKYDKSEHKMNLEVVSNKNWDEWDGKDVVDWLVGLDEKRYGKYTKDLTKNIAAEGVNGECLPDLERNDLHRLGITQFKDKKDVARAIQELVKRNNNTNKASKQQTDESSCGELPKGDFREWKTYDVAKWAKLVVFKDKPIDIAKKCENKNFDGIKMNNIECEQELQILLAVQADRIKMFNEIKKMKLCPICQELDKDCVATPCGHVTCCHQCKSVCQKCDICGETVELSLQISNV